MDKPTIALEHAINLVGSVKELARTVGVSPMAVYHWRNRNNGLVPRASAVTIEEATGGRVTRHQLRPDIFGTETFEDGSAIVNAGAGMHVVDAPTEYSRPTWRDWIRNLARRTWG